MRKQYLKLILSVRHIGFLFLCLMSFFLIILALPANATVTDGLMGFYDHNQPGDTSSVWVDGTGNGYSLTGGSAAIYSTGANNGKYAYFNGNTYFSGGNTYKYSNITVSAWLNTTASYPGSCAIVIENNKYSWISYALFISENGYPFFQIGTDTGVTTYGVVANTRINDGLWHLVSAEYDNHNLKIYVDGNLSASTPCTLPIVYDANTFGVGAHLWNYNRYTGSIGKVDIYNKALSDNENLHNYNAEKILYIPLAASFLASPSSGIAPLTVQFNDTSTGNPTNWTWYFGDGTYTGTYTLAQNITYTYTRPGLYNVTLIVNSSSGSSSTLTIPNYINVTGASFTSNVTTGVTPLTVQFNDTSTGNPTNWAWDFGDGTDNSTIQNATHTYTTPGPYNVTLTMYSSLGLNTLTKTNYIFVPAAYFTSNVTAGEPPLTVQFYDNSTGNPINYTWNFGDNSTSHEKTPMHTYTNNGSYNVTLTTGYDISGVYNTTTISNYITVNTSIYDASHVSDTTPNYQVVTGQSVAIDITMQNTGNQIWHLENGQVNIQEIDEITQTQCITPGTAPVRAGMTNTFPVVITAPSQPGNYTIQLQLYHVDNGTNVNFGPIVNIPLTVRTASIGVAWISNYSDINETIFNITIIKSVPLPNPRPDAEGLYNALGSIGWQQSFDIGDSNVNPSIFDTTGTGLTNNVDSVDLAYWSGHGGTTCLCTDTSGIWPIKQIGYAFFDSYLFDSCSWGGQLKWIGLNSCEGTKNANDEYGNGVTSAMKGVHVVCGFYTDSYDTPDLGRYWAYHMVKNGNSPAHTVAQAWFDAGNDAKEHGNIMLVWFGDQNCTNDYIWGQGPVAPDPDPNAQKSPSQPYPIP